MLLKLKTLIFSLIYCPKFHVVNPINLPCRTATLAASLTSPIIPVSFSHVILTSVDKATVGAKSIPPPLSPSLDHHCNQFTLSFHWSNSSASNTTTTAPFRSLHHPSSTKSNYSFPPFSPCPVDHKPFTSPPSFTSAHVDHHRIPLDLTLAHNNRSQTHVFSPSPTVSPSPVFAIVIQPNPPLFVIVHPLLLLLLLFC